MSKGPIRQLVPSLTSMIHLVATRECFGGSLDLHVPPNHLWLPRDLHLCLGRYQSCSVEILTTIRAIVARLQVVPPSTVPRLKDSMDLNCTNI